MISGDYTITLLTTHKEFLSAIEYPTKVMEQGKNK